MPAPPASAVAPKVLPISRNKDPTSVTDFPTSTTKFNYDLGKKLCVSIHEPIVCALPTSISPPPPALHLDPMAVPFIPFPSPIPASTDIPSVLASPAISDILSVAPIPAISDILPVVPSPVIADIRPVAPSSSPSDSIPSTVTPTDELDSLIDSSVEQFLAYKNWS